MSQFLKDQIFQHKDGGIYKFVQTVRYSDRAMAVVGVLYEHIWPFEKASWVRPLTEWTPDRFKPITPGEATRFIDSMTRDDAIEFIKANKAARKG